MIAHCTLSVTAFPLPMPTRHKQLTCRPAALLLSLLLLVCTSLAWSTGEDAIAVIYPDIGEPYRAVFEKIIEGIEDKVDGPLVKHPVLSDTDVNALQSTLRRQNTKVIIALGRQGMKTAAALDHGISVVVAGVLMVPEREVGEQQVISLSPDPGLLFTRLKTIMPAVKRVFVVYDPGLNGWLMKLAHEAARAHGLELVTYEAQDLRNAVKFYKEIFSVADSRRDALWLPQDTSTVEERSILPLVLHTSWNRNIAVFSSNADHARRGVLFSLYPDNVALGRRLAGVAQGFIDALDDQPRGLLPLRDVQIAVNLRTAKHLGLKPGRGQNFDMTFPEQ